jgi:hypothetical protein
LFGDFLEEVVEGFEVLIVDTQSAKEFPDSFDGIQLGAVWRKIVKVEALGASGRVMIAGIVYYQDRAAAATPMACQVSQEDGEGFRVER